MKDEALVLRITAQTDEFVKSLEEIKKRSSIIANEMKEIDKQLKTESVDRVGKLSEKLNMVQRQAELAAKEAQEYGRKISDLNKVNTTSAKEQENVNKKINDLTEKMALAIHKSETFTLQVEDLRKEIEQTENPAETLGENISDLGDAIEDAGSSADKSAVGINQFGSSVLTNLASAAIQKGIEITINLFKKLADTAWNAAKKVATTVWDLAQAGSNLSETQNKVDAVFKESSESVKEWADNAAHTVRTTKQVAMEHAASFGNIFTNMGMTTNLAAKYSTQLIEVAAAQADFNNLGTEDVIEKISSALTGNYQSLKALGIVMTEDIVTSKALSMTKKQNKEDLTDLEKTMARLELIFGYSTNAVEKFKENSGSLISLTAELKSRFGDLRDEIGAKLTPIFEQLFQKIADYLSSEEGQKMLDSIVEKVGKISEKIQEFVENGKLEEWITKFKEEIPQIISDLTDLAKIVGDLVQPILDVYHAIQGYNDLKNLDEAVKSSKKEVHAFAESMDIDMDTLRNAIKGYSEQQGISLTEIYGNWSSYQPKIAEYMAQTGKNSDEMKNQVTTATGEMASQTKTDLDATAEAFQNGLVQAGNADTSGLRAKTEEVESLGSRIKTALANFIDNFGLFQNAPGAEYAHRAAGGPALPGHIYQVNDDHGLRKEMFIPSVSGYILDGNQTQNVINNSTDNHSVGDVNVYVTSYGTNAAAIADEIGQEVNKRLRMSGAW